MTLPLIGAPLDRVDGRAKVTGSATFTAEFRPAGLAYAELLLSATANGRIERLDARAAREAPGVLLVMTHENAPKANGEKQQPNDPVLPLLQDDRVHFDRQPIAVIVAETIEQAKYAASLVRVRYSEEPAITEMTNAPRREPKQFLGEDLQHTRGDPEGALEAAVLRINHVYTTPVHHHNPIEAHATIAQWDGDALTVHDSTQFIFGVRRRLAHVFSMPEESVRVISPFVGGGFGCKGSAWAHVPLAAMAAKQLGRPVRVELSRAQMFGFVGFRPRTIQTISLGADRDGRLRSLAHDTVAQTAFHDDWIESSGLFSRSLYDVPNYRMTHRLARMHTTRPTFTRAPGEATGSFALESAMDELAYASGVDPIELRLRNYAETDPDSGKPFSSKSLRECYRLGAQRIEWERRNPQPGSMRRGGKLVGMGMATAAYPAWRSEASAYIRMNPDGSVLVQSGTQELGTGSYTIFSQIVAEVLGVPIERVRFELGDTMLPRAPISAGSQTAAAVGNAVYMAACSLRDRLSNGQESDPVEARADATPAENEDDFSSGTFGAQFAQVEVDPDLGEVRVVKYVGAFACGRVLNAKTARSQLMGGITWGIGMALMEQTAFDQHTGRVMSPNLVDYHVPVNADVPAIDVQLVEERDDHVNPIGVKGIGEVGITGVAAAIANAVFHATGVRVRDLPITPERFTVPLHA
jgi:xanthine dehydrogenase YagR molybdenum-binding subunit